MTRLAGEVLLGPKMGHDVNFKNVYVYTVL